MAAAAQAKALGRTVGILYILGTVFGITSAALTSSIASSDDILAEVAANDTVLAVGALLVLGMALVLAMIPVVAYPILAEVDTLLARGYFLFRSVLEGATYLMMVVAWLVLIPLSTSNGVPTFWGETLYDLESATVVNTIVFLIGATMFYLVLYRGRLVPRWISIWGLIAIVPYLVPVFLALFSTLEIGPTSTTTVLLDAPLGLQEMVLAVWLIVRGFAVLPRSAAE